MTNIGKPVFEVATVTVPIVGTSGVFPIRRIYWHQEVALQF